MRAAPRPNRTSLECCRGPLLYIVGLLCMIPVVTALCALILMALRASHTGYTSHIDASCCEEYVALLSRIVNRSINPCESIYDFICDRYSAQAAPGALLDTRLLEGSWGFKPSETLAGKLAYQYYRSCVMSTVQGERLGAQTASALLAFLGPSVNFPLRLIVEISLKYAIMFPVLFLSEAMFDLWPSSLPKRLHFSVHNLAVTLDTNPEPVMSAEAKQIYLRIRRDALRRVNEALSLNVSELEVDELYMALRVSLDSAQDYVASNLTDLHNLVPVLTAEEWRALLENVTRSRITGDVFLISDVAMLKRSLDILLDATSRPENAVFSLVEATSRLLIGTVLEKDNRDIRQRYFMYCHNASYVMVLPLLLVNLMETLNAGKLHDTMLQVYFSAITKAVSERAATLVAQQDVESVRRYVQRTRLLLPSEVFSLDLPLPTLTNNYAQNYLLMHASQWTLYSITVNGGVPKFITLKGILGRKPLFYNDVVVLPISVYLVVNNTSRIDRVVPLATFSMLIADTLWTSVLNSNWSDATTRRLERRQVCLTEENRTEQSFFFYHPELSLDTALDAARRKHWNTTLKFYSYQLQRISRSQLFFLLIIFHYYCPATKHAPYGRRRSEANHLFLRSDDFREAFGCGVKAENAGGPEC
ncbi:hypothetical protein V5799_020491 [Amblyomma americanum]|uniref:Uncharacterized protein n=1 Tax=Amblyomma americanum TaxID=6943 RepID=A0AAQ4ETS7_AMBAM